MGYFGDITPNPPRIGPRRRLGSPRPTLLVQVGLMIPMPKARRMPPTPAVYEQFATLTAKSAIELLLLGMQLRARQDRDEQPRLMSPAATATYLGIAEKTVRNHAAQIPGRRHLGAKLLFDRHELDEWIRKSDGSRDLWVDAAIQMK